MIYKRIKNSNNMKCTQKSYKTTRKLLRNLGTHDMFIQVTTRERRCRDGYLRITKTNKLCFIIL